MVVQGLKKHFGSFRAVKGVSMALRRGECFGLLGPNGAGAIFVAVGWRSLLLCRQNDDDWDAYWADWCECRRRTD